MLCTISMAKHPAGRFCCRECRMAGRFLRRAILLEHRADADHARETWVTCTAARSQQISKRLSAAAPMSRHAMAMVRPLVILAEQAVTNVRRAIVSGAGDIIGIMPRRMGWNDSWSSDLYAPVCPCTTTA